MFLYSTIKLSCAIVALRVDSAAQVRVAQRGEARAFLRGGEHLRARIRAAVQRHVAKAADKASNRFAFAMEVSDERKAFSRGVAHHHSLPPIARVGGNRVQRARVAAALGTHHAHRKISDTEISATVTDSETEPGLGCFLRSQRGTIVVKCEATECGVG